MPKDAEKYQYFTVGLLKNSFALEALKADAMKYHMIDQQAQLIALRLTEYYELLANSGPPVLNISHCATGNSKAGNGFKAHPGVNHDNHVIDEVNGVIRAPGVESEEEILMASADAEQNADLAADYWASL